MLISYVPLLRSHTNDLELRDKLKHVYFSSIKDAFKECLSPTRTDLLNECYELALLVYLHPIFDETQQGSCKKWLNVFENILLKLNEQKKNSINSPNSNQSFNWNNYANVETTLKETFK